MLLVLHCRAARRTAARSNECFAASAWHVANNACVPAISRAAASSIKLVASVLPLARKPITLPNHTGERQCNTATLGTGESALPFAAQPAPANWHNETRSASARPSVAIGSTRRDGRTVHTSRCIGHGETAPKLEAAQSTGCPTNQWRRPRRPAAAGPSARSAPASSTGRGRTIRPRTGSSRAARGS